ncbi:MAG: oligoendopeptidase F [bacterium]|nr:MAG: oligoendopeptidase F [bacterium]
MIKNKVPDRHRPFSRKFISKDFKITDAASIKPWVDKLLEREITSADEMADWLEDNSELQGIIGEYSNVRYVAMTCDTKSEDKKNAYLYFVREIQPKFSEWNNALNKKFYDSPAHKRLETKKYGRLDQMLSTAIKLYTEKNVPLEVRDTEMSQKYQIITGSWTVDFEGKTRTMPQMSLYLYGTDGDLRERAWKAMAARRLTDSGTLESLFDDMLSVRHEFAQNLGLDNYRGYCFKSKLRDYAPEDCLEFHDSIEKSVLPLVKKIAEKRKREMGVDRLRPWDMSVDPRGRPPLKPFVRVKELQDGVEEIFKSIDTRLGEMFCSIRDTMDLESRDGKAPGGYQTTFEERRIPFIFANSAGVHADVITLLHEGGHAFHTLSCRELPLIWYRHASMEFSEVASMTQELMGNPFLGVFYKDDEQANRARLEQLERVVEIFPWVATIDAFQHWIYTHPGHAREERTQQWLEISQRFEVGLDWSGLDQDIKRYGWHRQLHIFEVPFYYIEYAIAQLGALQIYRVYKKERRKAVDRYLDALALGGSGSPCELFAQAGIRFDFSQETIEPLMDMVEEEIESI